MTIKAPALPSASLGALTALLCLLTACQEGAISGDAGGGDSGSTQDSGPTPDGGFDAGPSDGGNALTVTGVLNNGIEGQVYLATLGAEGGTPPYAWSLGSGALPLGLSLSASGAINGTPTAQGWWTFSAAVHDSATQPASASGTFTLSVLETLSVATTWLPVGPQGAPYEGTLVARGGREPYTWSIASGALPAGTSLSPGGVISGTPGAAGPFALSFSVSDGSTPAQTATQSVTLTITASGGASYYVAPPPTGSDANPGTSAAPWATIAHAQSAVRGLGAKTAPLTVWLASGTYYNPAGLTFSAADNGGSSAATVTWAAAPGATPVINGGVLLPASWSHAGDLWQMPVPASVTQPFETLYYNGQRRLRPRLGDADAGTLGTYQRVADVVTSATPNASCPAVGGEVTDAGYVCFDRLVFDPDAGISASWKNLNPPPGNPCGAAANGSAPAGDVELDYFEAWTMERLRVSCIDPAKNIVYVTSIFGTNRLANFFGPVKGHRFVVENVQDLLTVPGQWFLDRSTTPWTLDYLAASGENPNLDSVVVPQAQPLLTATDLQWVNFTGLTFEVDNYVPGASGFVDDENGENTLPAAVTCVGCQNVVFDGVTVRHTSASGLQLGTDSSATPVATADVVVKNSAFVDLGAAGIHVGRHPMGSDKDADLPKRLTVQNNVVQGFSRAYADGEGIASGAMQDVLILHNDISDGYHGGISVCGFGCPSAQRGTSNVLSLFNHIWNVFQGITSDGGALYYNTGNAKTAGLGNVMRHNLVHDVIDSSIIEGPGSAYGKVTGTGYGGHGLYLDAQTAGASVESNVVYRVNGAGFNLSSGPGAGLPSDTVRNNVFANATLGVLNMPAPWPEGCPDGGAAPPQPLLGLVSNVFYFDRNETDVPAFHVQQACAYSCGLPYGQYENWQANDYWRTDGAFATDATAFASYSAPPTDVAKCFPNHALPVSFAQWQGASSGSPVPLTEDLGSVVADPRFADAGALDFTLAASPVPGFDPTGTNLTLQSAGRSNPVLQPAAVPASYPTYAYPDPATAF
jgi:hypothetical protein